MWWSCKRQCSLVKLDCLRFLSQVIRLINSQMNLNGFLTVLLYFKFCVYQDNQRSTFSNEFRDAWNEEKMTKELIYWKNGLLSRLSLFDTQTSNKCLHLFRLLCETERHYSCKVSDNNERDKNHWEWNLFPFADSATEAVSRLGAMQSMNH